MLLFRARCVIKESIYWPGEVCISQLQKILQYPEMKLYPVLFTKAEALMHSIKINQKVSLKRSKEFHLLTLVGITERGEDVV